MLYIFESFAIVYSIQNIAFGKINEVAQVT